MLGLSTWNGVLKSLRHGKSRIRDDWSFLIKRFCCLSHHSQFKTVKITLILVTLVRTRTIFHPRKNKLRHIVCRRIRIRFLYCNRRDNCNETYIWFHDVTCGIPGNSEWNRHRRTHWVPCVQVRPTGFWEIDVCYHDGKTLCCCMVQQHHTARWRHTSSVAIRSQTAPAVDVICEAGPRPVGWS